MCIPTTYLTNLITQVVTNIYFRIHLTTSEINKQYLYFRKNEYNVI